MMKVVLPLMKTSSLPDQKRASAATFDDDNAADSTLVIDADEADEEGVLPCVLSFNANDPSGAGGLAADALAVASCGAHLVAVVTGAYARDTSEIFDHFAFDEHAVDEQARAILQDVPVQVIKVGFVGNPELLGRVAEACSDYAQLPVVAYMPDLSWWNEDDIDAYLDAFRDLLLPQTTILVGNHATLRRWLLPDWQGERGPSARDIAVAAGAFDVPYALVTGLAQGDTHFENVLASPNSVICREKFERLPAAFAGAGDTLSAALAALIAGGADLAAAASEALSYTDRCLEAGYRPGMGQLLPNRLFWAASEDEADAGGDTSTTAAAASADDFALPPHQTRH
ncbi:MAG: bifunctional hydroxymethylpyrimidine kinase/phosphomethylpyrimidine kinase [Variovorax sp.]